MDQAGELKYYYLDFDRNELVAKEEELIKRYDAAPHNYCAFPYFSKGYVLMAASRNEISQTVAEMRLNAILNKQEQL